MFIVNYLKFLKLVYLNFRKKDKENKSVILVEFYGILPPLIGILFLIRSLLNIHSSKVIFYHTKIISNFIDLLKTFLKFIFFFKSSLIYLVFGAKPKFCIASNQVKDRAKIKFLEIEKLLKSKQDLLDLKLEGIEIGDLFYDNYMRQESKHSVEINIEFKKILLKYLNDFYYWYNYFNKNDVRSVIVSHAVYNLAIPLRIAQSKRIPAYIASLNFIEYFDENRKDLFQSEYRNSFKLLSPSEQEKALLYSKELLEKKFRGIHNYSENVGYGSNPKKIKNLSLNQLSTFRKKEFNKRNIFKKNGKPNVVIMAHCFYDAPHAVGKFLFPDFYEWVKHMGKISNQTNYNWYIKKHPHSVEKKLNDKIIENIISQYPKLELLDEEVGNNEILNDDISLLLTVHGSSAYEFSYNKIPVILGADNTSYKNYNFCYQPKTIKDFDYAIKNFKEIEFSYDKNEILRYYYNLFLAFWNLIPQDEYQRITHRKGNFVRFTEVQRDINLFKYFNKTMEKKLFNSRINQVEDFIKNKESRLFSKL